MIIFSKIDKNSNECSFHFHAKERVRMKYPFAVLYFYYYTPCFTDKFASQLARLSTLVSGYHIGHSG